MQYNPDKLIKSLEESSIYPFQKFTPTLGIILSTEATDDDKCYLDNIIKKAEKYGAYVDVRTCPSSIAAIKEIQSLRENSSINGIMILGDFGRDANQGLAESIPMRLDIDCMAGDTYGSLCTSTSPIGFRFGPCTAVACYKILEDAFLSNDFSELNVLVLGRSMRVGRPLAEILCQHNATVTVAHSKSKIDSFAGYDIVVSAVGKPKIWTNDYFSPDNTLIMDIGINVDENGRVCGDIHEEMWMNDDNLSCVFVQSPGGVGRVTTTVLFAKLFYNCALMHGEVV